MALLWLDPHVACTVSEAVSTLETTSPLSNNIAGIGEIFSGPSIQLYYKKWRFARGHPHYPEYRYDLLEQREKAGGAWVFSKDDKNIILLVSNPQFKAKSVFTPLQTKQIAPTILKALGLNPQSRGQRKAWRYDLPLRTTRRPPAYISQTIRRCRTDQKESDQTLRGVAWVRFNLSLRSETFSSCAQIQRETVPDF